MMMNACIMFCGCCSVAKASLATCSWPAMASGIQVWNELAFEPGDLVLEQQLAFLEPA